MAEKKIVSITLDDRNDETVIVDRTFIKALIKLMPRVGRHHFPETIKKIVDVNIMNHDEMCIQLKNLIMMREYSTHPTTIELGNEPEGVRVGTNEEESE